MFYSSLGSFRGLVLRINELFLVMFSDGEFII